MDQEATRAPSPDGRAAHIDARDPEDLAAILRPGINLCRIPRRLDPAFGAWLAARLDTEPFAVEAVLDAARPDPTQLVAATPPSPEREALAADIADLARRYARLAGCARVRAELAVQARDGCRKFHADYVGLRLLCTYAGPGTEWIPNEAVRREMLARPGVPIAEANRAIVAFSGAVRFAATGEVLLLKGEVFPGNAGNGAVHRSPPVEAAGARRLLLTLDSQKGRGRSARRAS
ncbi:DUF1826 domain-containing protein [Sorangium sp. So ce1000]|uniref:DUF1826 domain-containing protein n=1 Tax=Sorangium sp. So ce1000 TaxID=3133325 RepID=UPI003F60E196